MAIRVDGKKLSRAGGSSAIMLWAVVKIDPKFTGCGLIAREAEMP
jgi:hypothetical protein